MILAQEDDFLLDKKRGGWICSAGACVQGVVQNSPPKVWVFFVLSGGAFFVGAL